MFNEVLKKILKFTVASYICIHAEAQSGFKRDIFKGLGGGHGNGSCSPAGKLSVGGTLSRSNLGNSFPSTTMITAEYNKANDILKIPDPVASISNRLMESWHITPPPNDPLLDRPNL